MPTPIVSYRVPHLYFQQSTTYPLTEVLGLYLLKFSFGLNILSVFNGLKTWNQLLVQCPSHQTYFFFIAEETKVFLAMQITPVRSAQITLQKINIYSRSLVSRNILSGIKCVWKSESCFPSSWIFIPTTDRSISQKEGLPLIPSSVLLTCFKLICPIQTDMASSAWIWKEDLQKSVAFLIWFHSLALLSG